MTQAIEGYGTDFQYSSNGSSYTSLAEVRKITGPGIKPKSIDATHLLSPSAHMEFICGIVDGGEVTLDLNWLKTVYAVVKDTLVRVVYFYKIVFTTGSTLVFQGFPTDIGPEIPTDDRISLAVTFKVTGKPVFTA